MLSVGTTLSVWDELLTVGPVLGQGGEGTVYEVLDESGSARYALKWYFEHTAVAERRQVLADLVDRGAPHDRFLWPLGLIDGGDGDSFGYLMKIRPPDYVGVAKLLGLLVPRDERAVVQLAFELAHSFRALHTRGLCYRDISFGNVFLEPRTGHALICDNDNAGIDGVSPGMVRGTPKFMAPEVMCGAARPSKRTDQYSLAVLLFYLLMVGHPLEGRRTERTLADKAAHLRFYGYDPLFCFDPNDEDNRPAAGIHDHVVMLWNGYPQSLRDLFTRAFTVGIDEPADRVRDSEWCDAILGLRDVMFTCPCCSLIRFHDAENQTAPCPRCGEVVVRQLMLSVGSHRVVVSEELRLCAHHLNYDYDVETCLAVGEPHPTEPGVIGIKNATTEPWRYVTAEGEDGIVEPGARLRAMHGLRVKIRDKTMRLELASDRR